jgi:hypothetical protein
MKNFIFLIMIFAVGFSCGNTQEINRNWEILDYSFSSGPVSPEYQYGYRIIINYDRSCFIQYFIPGSDNFEYTFSIINEQMEMLNIKLNECRIFDDDIPSLALEEIPDGGSNETVSITVPNPDPNLDQPPRVFSSPVYPQEPYKTNLDKLYSYINELVPENIKAEAESKRLDIIKNKK